MEHIKRQRKYKIIQKLLINIWRKWLFYQLNQKLVILDPDQYQNDWKRKRIRKGKYNIKENELSQLYWSQENGISLKKKLKRKISSCIITAPVDLENLKILYKRKSE